MYYFTRLINKCPLNLISKIRLTTYLVRANHSPCDASTRFLPSNNYVPYKKQLIKSQRDTSTSVWDAAEYVCVGC